MEVWELESFSREDFLQVAGELIEQVIEDTISENKRDLVCLILQIGSSFLQIICLTY